MAMVLCFYENGQIQALDHTQPQFPLAPDIPERRGYDYERQGMWRATLKSFTVNPGEGRYLAVHLDRPERKLPGGTFTHKKTVPWHGAP